MHKWKIKILNSKGKYIDVGVTPIDFDINSATENNSGWYFAYDNSKLYSGLRKVNDVRSRVLIELNQI